MGPSKYLIAFAAGAIVGIGYGLIKVRSPAPPIIALVGLLGILSGEWCVRNFIAIDVKENLGSGEIVGPPDPGDRR